MHVESELCKLSSDNSAREVQLGSAGILKKSL